MINYTRHMLIADVNSENMFCFLNKSTSIIGQLLSLRLFLNTFSCGTYRALSAPRLPQNTDPLHSPPTSGSRISITWPSGVFFYPNKRQIRLVGMETESGGDTHIHTHHNAKHYYIHTEVVRRYVLQPS